MDAPRTLCCMDLSSIMQSKLMLFVDMVKIDLNLLDFCLAAFLLKLTRSRWHYKIEKHREKRAWITSTQYNAKQIRSKNGYQSDSVESESDFTRSAWYWYKSIQSYKAMSLSLSLGLNMPLLFLYKSFLVLMSIPLICLTCLKGGSDAISSVEIYIYIYLSFHDFKILNKICKSSRSI